MLTGHRKIALLSTRIPVYLEVGAKRCFASAVEWPGWCRSGKNEQAALEALAACAPRYAKVARLAKLDLPRDVQSFEVIERIPGNATTDFGAPGVPAKAESRRLTAKEAERNVTLLDACWKYLDQVRAKAPQALRKGPRGGGRDRDKMFDHVLGAEQYYAQAIGTRLKPPDGTDAAGVRAYRKAIRDSMATDPNRASKWPVAYAIRRTAWHAVDHAWEMEDRTP